MRDPLECKKYAKLLVNSTHTCLRPVALCASPYIAPRLASWRVTLTALSRIPRLRPCDTQSILFCRYNCRIPRSPSILQSPVGYCRLPLGASRIVRTRRCGINHAAGECIASGTTSKWPCASHRQFFLRMARVCCIACTNRLSRPAIKIPRHWNKNS